MHRRSIHLLGALLAAFLSIAVCSFATAQMESVVLRYEAPDPCPNEQQFVREIRARTSKLDRVDAGARSFTVSLRPDDAGYSGDLSSREHEVSTGPRHIVGETCEEVASAIALMIAIAIDPDASTGPVEIPTAPPPIQPIAAPVPSSPRVSAPTPRPGPPIIVPNERAWTASAGVELLLVGGLAPDVSPGVAIYGQLDHRAHDLVSPVVRWGIDLADSGVGGNADEPITVRRLVLHVEGCPVKWRPVRTVSMFPCVALEGGSLHGKGSNVERAESETRATFGAGLSAHAQWRFTPSWQLGLRTMAFSPMPRTDYVFENPRQIVYATPWVLWSVGMGIGWVGEGL